MEYYICIICIALYTLIPVSTTILGSAFVLFKSRVEEKLIDTNMGFAIGLMIYISFIDLLMPSIEISNTLSFIGFAAGFAFIKLLDIFTPHIHTIGSNADFKTKNGKTILIALAIAIHNIPEGFALGSSIVYDLESGFRVSLSIAVQDFPEGFAVALSVYTITGSRLKGFAIGTASAFVEYVSAFVALISFIDIYTFLPLLLAISASAMIYVAVHEIAPKIFGHEHDEYSTLGLFLGLSAGLLLEFVEIKIY
ncbi:MAG: ZIP family metal transporter [Archaeoglobaceae archaeon]|nr:ZIP family metal transporter [Archaeoglobaceae archaeon]MCX8151778.1 ZIP family metal transporter [Archaeoglobaceae archaeon]MDW8013197.1 ZIP family metal transporter [Archaeoglobaceae archaeon]